MKYSFSSIEKKWQKIWREKGIYEPDLKSAKKPFYNLMMFPYPSAEGLHVGNMYAFVGADIFGRMKRMQGNDVFEPIGLDGFGIHSENFALKTKTHPAKLSKVSEKNFYRQLEMIGNGFAWNEKLETYDPAYYRWTQWLFIQLFKNGLAYRKKQSVNWCPSCKTVLADEQVISEKCERCSHDVVKKELEQWFFRITQYADRLLENLEKIDWSERVKIAQKNWIGKSKGAEIAFKLTGIVGQSDGRREIKVFTTRPDTLFGATYIAISPELAKRWVDIGWKAEKNVQAYITKALAARVSYDESKEKTGVFAGIYAINPANNEKIPVWVADYVLPGYGTGAIMAVPAHDERDFEFAKKYKLQSAMVICPNYPDPTCPVLDYAYAGKGHLVGSGKFDGMDSEKAKWEITKFVGGKKQTQFRLRDWLISRQRYWGPPIPMIYCGACAKAKKGEQKEMPGWYSVPEKDLPVELPMVKDFRPKGKGESPLASVKNFYKVNCPACGAEARRETDVSDTFLDSAWYYLRYLNPINENFPFDAKRIKKWLPAALYTGGAEHSVLHLLYVRFIALALHDIKLLEFCTSKSPQGEPFPKFRAHGLLIKEGAKMSKSKGNVVTPDHYIKKFGADAFRMYLMFLAPFEQGGDFRDAGILGVVRFLERVWKFGARITKNKNDIYVLLHKTVKKVTDDIEIFHYNTAISALMILLSDIEKRETSRSEFEVFLKLLSPFAPHITEELWHELGNKDSIHTSDWPKYEEKFIKEETINLIIQVNGRFRATVHASIGTDQKQAEKLALQEAKVKLALGGKKYKKVIFIQNKIINFVM